MSFLLTGQLFAQTYSQLNLVGHVRGTTWSFISRDGLTGGVNDDSFPLIMIEKAPGRKIIVNGIVYEQDEILKFKLPSWNIMSPDNHPIVVSIVAP